MFFSVYVYVCVCVCVSVCVSAAIPQPIYPLGFPSHWREHSSESHVISAHDSRVHTPGPVPLYRSEPSISDAINNVYHNTDPTPIIALPSALSQPLKKSHPHHDHNRDHDDHSHHNVMPDRKYQSQSSNPFPQHQICYPNATCTSCNGRGLLQPDGHSCCCNIFAETSDGYGNTHDPCCKVDPQPPCQGDNSPLLNCTGYVHLDVAMPMLVPSGDTSRDMFPSDSSDFIPVSSIACPTCDYQLITLLQGNKPGTYEMDLILAPAIVTMSNFSRIIVGSSSFPSATPQYTKRFSITSFKDSKETGCNVYLDPVVDHSNKRAFLLQICLNRTSFFVIRPIDLVHGTIGEAQRFRLPFGTEAHNTPPLFFGIANGNLTAIIRVRDLGQDVLFQFALGTGALPLREFPSRTLRFVPRQQLLSDFQGAFVSFAKDEFVVLLHRNLNANKSRDSQLPDELCLTVFDVVQPHAPVARIPITPMCTGDSILSAQDMYHFASGTFNEYTDLIYFNGFIPVPYSDDPDEQFLTKCFAIQRTPRYMSALVIDFNILRDHGLTPSNGWILHVGEPIPADTVTSKWKVSSIADPITHVLTAFLHGTETQAGATKLLFTEYVMDPNIGIMLITKLHAPLIMDGMYSEWMTDGTSSFDTVSTFPFLGTGPQRTPGILQAPSFVFLVSAVLSTQVERPEYAPPVYAPIQIRGCAPGYYPSSTGLCEASGFGVWLEDEPDTRTNRVYKELHVCPAGSSSGIASWSISMCSLCPRYSFRPATESAGVKCLQCPSDAFCPTGTSEPLSPDFEVSNSALIEYVQPQLTVHNKSYSFLIWTSFVAAGALAAVVIVSITLASRTRMTSTMLQSLAAFDVLFTRSHYTPNGEAVRPRKTPLGGLLLLLAIVLALGLGLSLSLSFAYGNEDLVSSFGPIHAQTSPGTSAQQDPSRNEHLAAWVEIYGSSLVHNNLLSELGPRLTVSASTSPTPSPSPTPIPSYPIPNHPADAYPMNMLGVDCNKLMNTTVEPTVQGIHASSASLNCYVSPGLGVVLIQWECRSCQVVGSAQLKFRLAQNFAVANVIRTTLFSKYAISDEHGSSFSVIRRRAVSIDQSSSTPETVFGGVPVVFVAQLSPVYVSRHDNGQDSSQFGHIAQFTGMEYEVSGTTPYGLEPFTVGSSGVVVQVPISIGTSAAFLDVEPHISMSAFAAQLLGLAPGIIGALGIIMAIIEQLDLRVFKGKLHSGAHYESATDYAEWESMAAEKSHHSDGQDAFSRSGQARMAPFDLDNTHERPYHSLQ
jgi:hypothetical protein